MVVCVPCQTFCRVIRVGMGVRDSRGRIYRADQYECGRCLTRVLADLSVVPTEAPYWPSEILDLKPEHPQPAG
jgi:hypothetical protein